MLTIKLGRHHVVLQPPWGDLAATSALALPVLLIWSLGWIW